MGADYGDAHITDKTLAVPEGFGAKTKRSVASDSVVRRPFRAPNAPSTNEARGIPTRKNLESGELAAYLPLDERPSAVIRC